MPRTWTLVVSSLLIGFACCLTVFEANAGDWTLLTVEAGVRTIDGDTFEGRIKAGRLNGQTRSFRLAGIDAPERNSCRRAGQATRHLANLVSGRALSCLTSGTDRYDRLVVICWSADSSETLGQSLVANHLAVLWPKYAKLLPAAIRDVMFSIPNGQNYDGACRYSSLR